MYSIEEVMDRAIEVMGDDVRATEWLNHMSNTLGSKPCDLMNSDAGRKRVMLHLRSIEQDSVTDL
jgi:uncharacterized protein (DUF2384 family)